METLIRKWSCMREASKNPEAYYRSLSTEELKARHPKRATATWVTFGMWLLSAVLIVYSAKMSTPVLVLYLIAVAATVISIWINHFSNKKMIEKILKERGWKA